jgi:hypothetical protein
MAAIKNKLIEFDYNNNEDIIRKINIKMNKTGYKNISKNN